jgi:hypothetical protein
MNFQGTDINTLHRARTAGCFVNFSGSLLKEAHGEGVRLSPGHPIRDGGPRSHRDDIEPVRTSGHRIKILRLQSTHPL